jgi:hypothetical protein
MMCPYLGASSALSVSVIFNITGSTTFGDLLWDFERLLSGQKLNSRRTVLGQMILSISRAFKQCVPLVLQSFLYISGLRLELDVLDGLSDQYWLYKLDQGMYHENAWKETGSTFESKWAL